MTMQRNFLVLAGLVRAYLLTPGAPSLEAKRCLVFGADDDGARDLSAEGVWYLAPPDLLVGDGWQYAAGTFSPAPLGMGHRKVTAMDFLGRFTPTETAALWAADARLMAGAMKVMTQGSANLDSAEATALMALAVAKGVLTPARVAIILA